MKTIADIDVFLNTLPESISAALLQVKTKSGGIELREERGKWLEELSIKLKTPEISECRSSWDELFLFAPNLQKVEFERSLVSELENSTHPDLDSYLIVAIVTGPDKAKRKRLDEMQLQLHKINYWNEHTFDYYYENGRKIALKTS